VPNCAPTTEIVATPEGSSSENPAFRPGASAPRNFLRKKGYSENVASNTSSWKNLFKPSSSADAGFLNSPVGAQCGTSAELQARRDLTSQFLNGYSTSLGGYYGPGGSIVYSPGSGTATRIGIGMSVTAMPGSVGKPILEFGK